MTIAKVVWIGPLRIPSSFCASYIGLAPNLSTSHIRIRQSPIPMNKYGLMIPTVTVTVIVLKTPWVMNTTNGESTKSITVMSFENLVTILPTGFESKKMI